VQSNTTVEVDAQSESRFHTDHADISTAFDEKWSSLVTYSKSFGFDIALIRAAIET
jgi:hypothetical protein